MRGDCIEILPFSEDLNEFEITVFDRQSVPVTDKRDVEIFVEAKALAELHHSLSPIMGVDVAKATFEQFFSDQS